MSEVKLSPSEIAEIADPCALAGQVNCTDDRTGSHISSLVFASQLDFGNLTIPDLAELSYLHTLDFSGDMIGTKLSELPFKQYVGVDGKGGCKLSGNPFPCHLPKGSATSCTLSAPT